MYTFDRRTVDATGAYLVGELERLDKTLHAPLASVSWGRDIDLREDVTIADESSSFITTNFAAAGGLRPNGKNWIAGNSNAIAGIAMSMDKTPLPLHLWGMELGYSIPELAAAQQVGRPIDSQKFEGLKLKHNMDVDEMVYIGDTDKGATGLVNNSNVTPGSAAKTFASSTPGEILAEINSLIESVWQASAFSACPTHLLLPPVQFGLLTTPVSTGADKSILQYLSEQCLSNATNGRPLVIYPLKWLTGRGASSSNRMVAYTKNPSYVRYPLVPLQRTPLEYRGIHQLTTYFGRLGEVEFVYPETVGYTDGI